MTVEPYRNGTAAPAFPIKTVDIHLDDFGYPGWTVTMRTNPRASVYDALVSLEEDRWWQAFGQVVQTWNLVGEDGQPLPLPSEVASEKELDLPHGPLTFIFSRYIDAVNAGVAIPKERESSSSPTASTNAEVRSAG